MAQRSERLRGSMAERLAQMREREMREQLPQGERPGEGLVVSIPSVGSLSWDCNNDRDFAFTFTPEQASITVEQSVNGEVTRTQLHPGQELTSEFLPPEVRREWIATYRHKPALISARISAEAAVRRGACFIRSSTLEQSRRPN